MDLTQLMLFHPIAYIIIIVVHILASCVAVGAVAVTDYFHLIGLKNHKLEKKIILFYPYFSQIITISLIVIILTGILLVINRPALLYKSLFQVKMTLVLIVIVNGIILQRKIAPHVERLISHDLPFTEKVLFTSSLCGTISIVTWFSILILALTKNTGYTWNQFVSVYLAEIFFVYVAVQFFERKARRSKDVENILKPESAVQSIVSKSLGAKVHHLKNFEEAKKYDEAYLVMNDEHSGQMYLSFPVKLIQCSSATLQNLLKEIDAAAFEFNKRKGTVMYFERKKKIGGVATDSLWVHEDFKTMKEAIFKVLTGKKKSVNE